MQRLLLILLFIKTSAALAQPSDSIKAIGKLAFAQSCSNCHNDSLLARIPGVAVLSTMTPRAILSAMDNGKMRQQAMALHPSQRKAIAEWLTGTTIKITALPKKAFTAFRYTTGSNSLYDYSGWGGDLTGRGFRASAQAGINSKNVASLQLKWAFAFPDATISRSKPAVLGDWLLVGSQFGDLYAINKQSGKIGWHFSATAAIRGAIVTMKKGKRVIACFADFTTNVYAIDVQTGKLIWNTRAGFEQQSTVTGSVAVAGGKVFVPISSAEVAAAVDGNYKCCSSSGGLVALNATTGKLIWQHRVIDKPATISGTKKNGKPFYGPSGAPVWCSPTIDEKRGLVYIGTGENYTYPATGTSDAVQALDMRTGELKWNFQATSNDAFNAACPFFLNCPDKPGPDLDFGMAPILTKNTAGKDILLAGQKSGVVYSLSPDSGILNWKTRIGKGGALGGIHWGMATDGKLLYAANADNPLGADNSSPEQKTAPGIYALNINTGNVVWKAGGAMQSAAPAVVPGIVFAGSLDGYIRAYDSSDGKMLWEFDTAKTYDTVNGIEGRGGALDGPAPVIAGGMLFVNSGYGMFGQAKGNVLLAFEIKKNKH